MLPLSMAQLLSMAQPLSMARCPLPLSMAQCFMQQMDCRSQKVPPGADRSPTPPQERHGVKRIIIFSLFENLSGAIAQNPVLNFNFYLL